MLSNLNLNLLRSLYVLIDECHVSRAAERLHLTQSAASRQLSQLREVCNDPLLVRNGNSLIPTQRATELHGKIKLLLSDIDHLLEDSVFDPKNWEQNISFSASDYVAQFIVPELVQLLSSEAPKLDINFKLWQPSYLNQLIEQEIHLASTMLPDRPDNLSSVQIGEDFPVCLMNHAHPLADKVRLNAKDLVAFAHIKITGGGDKDSEVDQILKRTGLKRRIAVRLPFFSAAQATLASSEHLQLLPEHIAINLCKDAPLVYKHLELDTTPHRYWLLWHPKYDQDKAHLWFRQRVLEIMNRSDYSIGYELKS
ncbi:transcriptional regulator [Vibrio ishigakensis]|uniref:Transcriptional regulator n=1 Tax=Vibrio ishigakensis TaxID=1481914 RepID=A0A0B8PAJ7_9VIBR|nr:transcriptional regulator [Vibrio ishigakensis]